MVGGKERSVVSERISRDGVLAMTRRITITETPSEDHPRFVIVITDRAFELTKVCADPVEVLREVLGWVSENNKTERKDDGI